MELNIDKEKISPPTQGNSSGGGSVGCAGLFVLAGLIWPLLHLLGGSYEPET